MADKSPACGKVDLTCAGIVRERPKLRVREERVRVKVHYGRRGPRRTLRGRHWGYRKRGGRVEVGERVVG